MSPFWRDLAAIVRAEWRRLFARRFTLVMGGSMVLLLALAGFAVGAHSHPHTAATLASAQEFVDGQRAQNLELCLSDARAGIAGPDRPAPPTEDECRQNAQRFQPSLEQFQGYQFTFRRDMSTLLVLLGGLLALFGFVVGASFAGAEWSTGGMMTMLVWRPRRLQVLGGKLLALLLGVAAFTAAASAVWTGVMWVVARTRGGTGEMTSGLVISLGLRDARVLALALACAAAGFGLATLGRHTATALGTAIGYLVAVEVVARIALSAAHVERPQRFFLSSYALSWLDQSTSYTASDRCIGFDCRPVLWTIGAGTSAALLGTILIVALLTAAVTLRRRDVA